MTTLVVGASGATGRLLVQQLLDRGETVRAIVRGNADLRSNMWQREGLSLILGNVLELDVSALQPHVRGCTAIASCLGHHMSIEGLFGAAKRLVTDTTRKLCEATTSIGDQGPRKFVLMNSAGCRNRDLEEQISFGQKVVIGLLKVLLAPHADNENAANYLRTKIGANDASLKWAVVRPDNLTNEGEMSPYTVHASPTRSAIFDPGKTSRINVACFMAELITCDDTWRRWSGKMPVLYNVENRHETVSP